MTKKRLYNSSRDADNYLDALEPKKFKQVFNKIMALCANPRPSDSSKLKGYDNKYRADIGEYRIVYTFNDEVLNIELVSKRNDDEVYKKLKRK